MVSVTEDTYNHEVSWELTCGGLSAPVSGGSPYSETHAVPPGTCTLVLMDAYGDGWQGATWTAPGWTDQSYTLVGGSEDTVSIYVGPQPPSPPMSCGPGTSASSDGSQCEISCSSGGRRRAAEEGAAERSAAEKDTLVHQLIEEYLTRHPNAAAMHGELFTLMETGLKAISTLTAHPEAASMMESMTDQLFLQPAPA